MSLKNKLYARQWGFIKPLLAAVILLGLWLAGVVTPEKTGVPGWLFYIVLAIVVLFAVFKTFWGVVCILSAKENARGKCAFALLHNKNPQVKTENAAEQYALLATTFYEASEICFGSAKDLAGFAADPNYLPPQKFDEQGDYRGDSQYVNSIEGMLHLDKKDAEYRLAQPLAASWGITNGEEALEQMNALWASAQESANAPAGQDLQQTVRDFGFAYDGAAADTSGFHVVRFIWVARSAFTLGYVNEETVRGALATAAAFIAQHYADWRQFAFSYLLGYAQWSVSQGLGAMSYSLFVERVNAVSQALDSQTSPLHGTSLDALREALKQ
ncbi:Uncharacterised protein [Kingella potus]|uniref:DUF1266 domain-containing protein n=1 Tax=Kingella potus TaxID=265175 RepID=A0A377QYE0_9NEIS|nr:DUF1266 domain-containing protein [Kingella potus]UOP01687.1 DUF1266 domain-containing protein [Kingella potus]STR00012.1 Uncharacterised protein [Kingella potus]